MDRRASESRGKEVRRSDRSCAAKAACRMVEFFDFDNEPRTLAEETLVESRTASQSSRERRSSRSSCSMISTNTCSFVLEPFSARWFRALSRSSGSSLGRRMRAFRTRSLSGRAASFSGGIVMG